MTASKMYDRVGRIPGVNMFTLVLVLSKRDVFIMIYETKLGENTSHNCQSYYNVNRHEVLPVECRARIQYVMTAEL